MCSLNAISCGPNPPVCVKDFEVLANDYLMKDVRDYYNGGACEQTTLQNNLETFKRYRILPRCLVDASHQDLATKVLGKKVKVPVGVCPSALQKMAHPEGEIGNASAVGTVGGIYILSTLSSTSLEEVRKGAPGTTLWFQLYIYKDRDLMTKMVKRAEAAGYEALVLTVDANIFGIRFNDEKNNFDMPPWVELGNFSTEEKKERLQSEKSEGSALRKHVQDLFDPSISWKDVKWLKSITSLPIVLKGVLTAADAKIAIEKGVAAIMVSNHGGRQLDTCPAAIEALPEIVNAVGGQIEVYFDSGVRLGTDVFKALALGAKMVFVGRPALWGLACGGQEGVEKVLNILIKELKTTMGLAGCQRISDIKKSSVVHESYYSRI